MLKELQSIGLTKEESQIYIQLLKKKYQPASELAKITQIGRGSVYNIIESLLTKGLTSYVIRNNTKYFIASDPSILLDILLDKQESIKSIIPALNKLNQTISEKVTVEIYQGKKGGMTILKDILRTGKDYVSIGEDGSFEDVAPLELKQYIRQLNEKKIKEKILAKEGTKVMKSKYSEIRYLPKEYQIPTITTIYGDKVAIALFTHPYYVILIKSKALAKSYNSFFNIMWETAK